MAKKKKAAVAVGTKRTIYVGKTLENVYGDIGFYSAVPKVTQDTCDECGGPVADFSSAGALAEVCYDGVEKVLGFAPKPSTIYKITFEIVEIKDLRPKQK